VPDSLPQFRYHPNPLATGTVERSDRQCVVCGRASGYIYKGPIYAERDLDERVCPWCIADGRAHRELGAEFFDAAGVGDPGDGAPVPDSVVDEIVQRTPSFTGWQQERWLTCCGDAAAFIGHAGKTELEVAGEQAVESIRTESGYEGDEWQDFLVSLDAKGSPTAYLFRCLHCGKVAGYSDFD